MQYTLRLKGNDSRLLDIPAGTRVAVIFPTRLGFTASDGLESTIDLPKVTAIIDQYGGEIVVATGTVLHGDDSDARSLAAVAAALAGPDDGNESEPRRVPVIL